MGSIAEIDGDSELNTALVNFSTACCGNSIILGLTPANLTEISAASNTFTVALLYGRTARIGRAIPGGCRGMKRNA